MNIQDEVMEIHSRFGTSEMANYHIQLLFERFATSREQDAFEAGREGARAENIGIPIIVYRYRYFKDWKEATK